MQETLTAEGIWNIIDYQMFPWGNAYYNSTLLDGCPNSPGGGYNRDRYTCWSDRCNSTTAAPELCWNGTKLCQHGPGECEGDSLEVCAMSAYPSPTIYTQFVYCFEQSCLYDGDDPTASTCNMTTAFIEQCAAFAGVSATPILECYEDEPRVAALDLVVAKATAALGTSKTGTPFVLVDGAPLDDVDLLLPAVCGAWQAQDGQLPAGCVSSPDYDWMTWQEGVTLGAGLGGGLLLGAGLMALCYCGLRKKRDSRRAPLLDLAGSA